MEQIINTLFAWGLILFLYFYPALLAWKRGHHQTEAIFILTLLLGWTGLGWVIALIWAHTTPRAHPKS